MSKPTVVSLFAGAGGMDLGFINAGYEIVWANDFEKDAVDTYRENIGDHIILGDISKIDSSEIPDNPDVVIGGFPCQGFSIANTKRNMEDKRNFLYREMLRVIRDKKPRVFVAENVKGLLSMEKGKVLQMIINDFKELGYNIDYRVLNAADYGVPQRRERVFIIGSLSKFDDIYPQKTHGDNISIFDHDLTLKKPVTVSDTISYLQDVPLSDFPIELENETVYNHQAATNVHDKFFGRKYPVNQADVCDYLREHRIKKGISVKKIDEIFGYKHTAGHWFRKDNSSGSIPKPKDWLRLKEILEFDETFDEQVLTFVEKEIVYEQSLRITNWDTPSDTITATSPEIHINKERRLSARECAKIQTFPDDFIFKGSLNSMYRQIGNAVPTLLSEKIALNIKEHIKSEQVIV